MMVLSNRHHEENAVNFAALFLQKFAASIIATLCCFDRVILKGHLPFGGEDHLNAYVDHVLNMRRKDFLPWLERHSQRLVEHAQAFAQRQGRGYEYHQGKFCKERHIQHIIRRDQLSQGLVAVLCVQEHCRTVALRYAKRRPRLVFQRRPQRVLYYYWIDAQFGLMYVRLQTWFPYTIQVYVNGHDWLARQMQRRRVGFVQHDNAFTQLDDPAQAQKLADRFAGLPWVKQLTRWARRVNPLLVRGGWLSGMNYYWVTEQAEYATDILFSSRQQLRDLYPRLLDHALVNFSARDVLTFLGRKLHGNFQGEVLTDCRKHRHPGARVKHRVKDNWLKMYDKFGLILRVETVINQPREFRVRRRRMREGHPQMVWCPMNKGVGNLPSYQQQARAANERYLNALSVVENPTRSYQHVAHLSESKVHRGRRYAGFNPARRKDIQLFQAVMRGEHQIRGFYNAHIREALWGQAHDHHHRTRQSRAVSRLLKRLHVRGVVAKIPHTRRWRITATGQQLLGAILQLHYHGLATAA
jgi:hypothetical protein